MISYIVCKWREKIFNKCVFPALEEQRDKFGAELIIVQHPDSIFAAYEEGRQKARYEILVYIHDDSELLDPETSSKLVEIFKANKELGLVGVLGSAGHNVVPWWRNVQLLGHFMCPDPASLARPLSLMKKAIVSRLGKQSTLIYNYSMRYGDFRHKRLQAPDGGLRAWHKIETKSKWYGLHSAGFIDGMFMAERRNEIPWDMESFKGWHCYDLDRSLQIRAAGWQVAVSDLLVLHYTQAHNWRWYKNHRENLKKMHQKWGVERVAPGWRQILFRGL